MDGRCSFAAQEVAGLSYGVLVCSVQQKKRKGVVCTGERSALTTDDMIFVSRTWREVYEVISRFGTYLALFCRAMRQRLNRCFTCFFAWYSSTLRRFHVLLCCFERRVWVLREFAGPSAHLPSLVLNVACGICESSPVHPLMYPSCLRGLVSDATQI